MNTDELESFGNWLLGVYLTITCGGGVTALIGSATSLKVAAIGIGLMFIGLLCTVSVLAFKEIK